MDSPFKTLKQKTEKTLQELLMYFEHCLFACQHMYSARIAAYLDGQEYILDRTRLRVRWFCTYRNQDIVGNRQY